MPANRQHTRSLRTPAAMLVITGTLLSATALAGAEPGRDEPMRRATPKQVERDQARTDEAKDAARAAAATDPASETAPGDTNLAQLEGTYRITVKHFTKADPAAGEARADQPDITTGYAQRRWVLDGSKLLETYTLDGTRRDMPLNLADDLDAPLRERAVPRDRVGNSREINPELRDRPTDEQLDTDNDGDKDIETYADEPLDPADRGYYEGTDDREPMMDRRARVNGRGAAGELDRHAATNGAQAQGIVMWGYDDRTDTYTVVWTDSNTPAIRADKGKLSDDGTLTLTGEYTDADGETYSTRTVITIESPARQTLTMYRDAGLLSAETKVLEVVYARDDAPRMTANVRTSTPVMEGQTRVVP